MCQQFPIPPEQRIKFAICLTKLLWIGPHLFPLGHRVHTPGILNHTRHFQFLQTCWALSQFCQGTCCSRFLPDLPQSGCPTHQVSIGLLQDSEMLLWLPHHPILSYLPQHSASHTLCTPSYNHYVLSLLLVFQLVSYIKPHSL